MQTTTRPHQNLLDPQLYVDLGAMHEAFTWMRAEDPLHRDEANGLWAVTRHADVVDVEPGEGLLQRAGATGRSTPPARTT